MARSNGAMGSSVCGIMMMMMMVVVMIMGAAGQAPAPAVNCQDTVLTLIDCLDFVSGTAKTPSAACCKELSTVVSSSPQCLCQLFNTSFTGSLGINVTIAQQLPPLCKVQTPPTSLCSQYGIPAPGPVSSPVTAPAKSPASSTPAKAPASSTAPAPAPVAPASSPTSPSPSSSSSPTPSSSSTPSPSTSTPTASTTSPPASPTQASTPPSPNSAPVIESRNAVAAASLLFLASIFLS